MAHIIQITTFFHPVKGGVEQQVLDLSKQLIRQGHNVTVFCSDSTRSDKRMANSEKRLAKIRIKRLKTWFSFSQFYKFYPGLFFELLKTKFDIVHVHGFRKFEIYPALLAAKLKRKKIVVTTHNPFVTTSRSKLLQLFVNLHDITFGKLFTRFIDNIICLTTTEIPFVEKFNVKKEKIIVIPNGITKDALKIGNANRFIKNYQIPVKDFKYKVLWIGRLNKVKGLENLEIAIKQLDDTLFIFAGPDDNAVEEYKNLYHSFKNVVFTGAIKHKDTIHAYNSADLFVLPSHHEAFGVVLLEAMAQGLPIISTNVGGPSEIINENFGILLNPNDQWGWMMNIKKLLKNINLRKQMGENAKQEVKSYIWDTLIYRLLEVYGIKKIQNKNSKLSLKT